MSERSIGYLHEGFDQDGRFEVNTRDGLIGDFHDGNLFEQNENSAGDHYDLASGKRYDNSTATDEGFLVRHDIGYVIDIGEGLEDEMQGDAVDEWIREEELRLQRLRMGK